MLDLGATMTLACSSTVKFCHVRLLSINCLYNSKISLWLIAPGFVKFIMPVNLLSACNAKQLSASSKKFELYRAT